MRSLLYLAAPLALLLPMVAHATEYELTITVGSTQVADLFITSSVPGGPEGLIATGLTGTDGGADVTLLAPGAYYSNDNSFSTTPFYFDDGGFGFTNPDNGTDYNVYYTGSQQFYCDSTLVASCHSGQGSLATVTLTPFVATATTPEPSSMLLLSTGILGVAGFARRKFLKA